MVTKFIYATYNPYCNSIDITTFDNVLLRIDCNKAEDGLKTTPNSQRLLDTLAIDNPLEYARLVMDNEMQVWIDAEDSLEVWCIIGQTSIGKNHYGSNYGEQEDGL